MGSESLSPLWILMLAYWRPPCRSLNLGHPDAITGHRRIDPDRFPPYALALHVLAYAYALDLSLANRVPMAPGGCSRLHALRSLVGHRPVSDRHISAHDDDLAWTLPRPDDLSLTSLTAPDCPSLSSDGVQYPTIQRHHRTGDPPL